MRTAEIVVGQEYAFSPTGHDEYSMGVKQLRRGLVVAVKQERKVWSGGPWDRGSVARDGIALRYMRSPHFKEGLDDVEDVAVVPPVNVARPWFEHTPLLAQLQIVELRRHDEHQAALQLADRLGAALGVPAVLVNHGTPRMPDYRVAIELDDAEALLERMAP